MATAVGTGAALYGANKQSKDNKAAQNQNAAMQAEQNLSNWQNYILQRGLDPSGVSEVGQMPTNARAVNSRLPLYATLTRATGNTPLTVTRKAGPPTAASGLTRVKRKV